MYYRPVTQQKPRRSEVLTFPAAVAGWISNQNLAAPPQGPQGAVVLENIFPTATGGILRRGSSIYATLGGGELPVTALFSYNNGNNRKLFAANAETVYDITIISTPINYTLGTDDDDQIVTDTGDYLGQLSTGGLEVIIGATGGNWIDTQFATTGGTFLIIVNGEDEMFIYDGSLWFSIDEYGIYTLDFDAEVSEFVVGETVTGGTSGATGYIAHVDSTGTTGRLYLADATGTFQDNETITSASGEATVNGVATPYYTGIEGVETQSLDYVWVYKNRLFFVQKDSMNAWYLPVDQVGGEAEVFPLGGVFTLGGKLLFGASWSLDSSGSGGLSEQCVFVSDQGEVAVYQGTNPASATDWNKVGTYQIGKPLGPKAWIRAGGDIIIATDIGFIPLSQAIQRDVAALSPSAVSFPIETAWNEAVSQRRASHWHAIVWPESQMVVISLPTINQQSPEMFVANARTGAWAKFTNWDGTCLEVFNGRLFFGSVGGKVIEANVTGNDQDQTYTGVYVPLFLDFGNSAARKVPRIARAVTRGPQDINPQLSVVEDYIVNLPPPPSASGVVGGSEWGVGIWGQAVWGQSQSPKIQQNWTSVSGYGYAMAPALQITSGSIVPLDSEIIRLELTFETADIVT
jgi:hypothetical protein